MSDESAVLDKVPKKLLIGGDWVDGSEGTLPVEDPATQETLTEVADASPDDAVKALDAAVDTQKEWQRTPPRERGEILRRAWEEITERADELALLMTLEMGKSLAESKAEITYGSEFLRWFAEEAVRIDGRYAVAPNGQGRLLTMKQPVGPSLMITPWNFPLAMGTRKIGPAVAAGCTMVVKPAKQTPLSMLALAEILANAGLPPRRAERRDELVVGVGDGAADQGPAAAEAVVHRLDRGRQEADGAGLRPASAPVDGARRQRAVPRVRRRRPRRRGRGSDDREDAQHRRGVHGGEPLPRRGVARRPFAEKLAERMSRLKLGRGTEEGVDVGPLIDGDQRAKVQELVDDAQSKGAKVVVGGSAREGQGYFYEPTVLADIPDDAKLLKEEIFGPVAPVKSFDSEEEAIAAANDTEYGLVAYVYTRDVKRALRVCEALEYGMVGLNQGMVSNPAAPFGGIKQSGFGREGGYEGIEEYLETKYVATNL